MSVEREDHNGFPLKNIPAIVVGGTKEPHVLSECELDISPKTETCIRLRVSVQLKHSASPRTFVYLYIPPAHIRNFTTEISLLSPDGVRSKFGSQVTCLHLDLHSPALLVVPASISNLAPKTKPSGDTLDALRALASEPETRFDIYISHTLFRKTQLQSLPGLVLSSTRRPGSFDADIQSLYSGTGGRIWKPDTIVACPTIPTPAFPPPSYTELGCQSARIASRNSDDTPHATPTNTQPTPDLLPPAEATGANTKAHTPSLLPPPSYGSLGLEITPTDPDAPTRNLKRKRRRSSDIGPTNDGPVTEKVLRDLLDGMEGRLQGQFQRFGCLVLAKLEEMDSRVTKLEAGTGRLDGHLAFLESELLGTHEEARQSLNDMGERIDELVDEAVAQLQDDVSAVQDTAQRLEADMEDLRADFTVEMREHVRDEMEEVERRLQARCTATVKIEFPGNTSSP